MSKPINEMSLTECLDEIRTYAFFLEDPELEEVADRIHELTRWIPVSERLPTKEDADDFGFVEWYIGPPNNERISWAPFYPHSRGATHWRRIETPEAKP